MSCIYSNVLSKEDIEYLNTRPEVLAAKDSLDTRTSGMVYFSVPITESIRATVQARFGLGVGASIPMRWIKGDTAPHVDVGASPFEKTYLLYLNDSPGEMVIDSQRYPIEANSGFIFNEGLSHETVHTENVPRLLLGPMNELAEPVGAPSTRYYIRLKLPELNNLVIFTGFFDVDNITNIVQFFYDSTNPSVNIRSTGNNGGPTYLYQSGWLSFDGGGCNITSFPYLYGATEGDYNLYGTTNSSTGNVDSLSNVTYEFSLTPFAVPCFLEGTTVLCQVDGVERYVPVQQLTKGTLVKTSLDGYKPLVLLGKGSIQNPGDDERTKDRLYKCSPSNYPELTEDLFITGCHSILEGSITDKQKEDTLRHLGRVFVTDKKYRLIACVDERADPWNSKGIYTIYHFALEHENERMNYGVYVNGGLLVETCSMNTLKTKSNLVCNV
jgi:hypothetical protein